MNAKIWNYSEWLPMNNESNECLKKDFKEKLRISVFHILGINDHVFHPFGYTALWLLSESHFALHTFPEFGKYYIELSSCNFEYYVNMLNQLNKQ